MRYDPGRATTPPKVNGHDVAAVPLTPEPSPPPRAWQPPPVVDYATVRQLHRAVADELAELLRQAGPAEKLDPTALGEQLVARHVKEYVDAERLRGNLITDSDERALQDAVAGELVGLGRLKILLADPQVENIHVLGYDRVRVERSDGSIVEAGPITDSDEELLQLL